MHTHAKIPGFLCRAALISWIVAGAVALSQTSAQILRADEPGPTAVSGESWLAHLQRSFDETSMGKTGRLGPPAQTASEPVAVEGVSSTRNSAREKVMLRGSDVYRMNCRGCHGESGAGAPPEINSVINPVRATSAATVLERMKSTGMEVSRSDAVRLSQQSKVMLLERIHHGGQDMPAFPYLSPKEVDSLLAYLRLLSGIRGVETAQRSVQVGQLRRGEYIAKSTCHICHAAVGPNPTEQQLYFGAIPPLSTLTLRLTRPEFIRKVTQGAPVMMGTPPMLLRGRMPVFYYLSEQEAADVYSYLEQYPPSSPTGTADTATADSPSGPFPSEIQRLPPPSSPGMTSPGVASLTSSDTTQTADNAEITVLSLVLGFLASLMLFVGFWISVCELRRLAGEGKAETAKVPARQPSPGAFDPELAA